MRPLFPILLMLPLGLLAQDNPGGNRMGLGLATLQPAASLGDLFGTGFQVGLQIHFNRESRHLGRLRIDYLQMDSKHPLNRGDMFVWNGSGYDLSPLLGDSRMEAHSIAYEWMPHLEPHSRSGLFAILGVGGTLWNETTHYQSPYPGSESDGEWGFTLSGGAGWRFNPHVSLEARFVRTDLSFHGRHNYRYGPTRSYLTFGTSLRF